MKAVARIPLVSVLLDGAPLRQADAQALESVRVQQRLSQPSHCELTFSDPQGDCSERNHTLPGSALQVALEGEPTPLFSGRVTAAEYLYPPSGDRKLILRAYDALHGLRHRQPVRAHVQVTLAELARELVADLGLPVEAEEPGPLWQKIVQTGQSDLDLLIETAERCGLYFFLGDDVLQIFNLRGRGEPVALVRGSSLLEARIEVNADPACGAVTALGWDPWRAEEHQGTSAAPRCGRQITASAAGTPESTLVDESVQDDDQASALAQAELDRRNASTVRFTGVADGDPGLRPGVRVDLKGVDDSVSGRYVLSATNHILDRVRGFVTELDTGLSPRRRRPGGSGATIGVVSDISDPDALGRVRVRLPGFADVESDWFEVLSPGAGQNKGLVALPDVGDRVLTLLTRNDPAQGVVVGGLYGVNGPPDDGIDDGEIRRFTLVTPGGQRLRLDDTKKRVLLENNGGNRLELSPGRARIRNGSGSYVELAGKRVVVHAEDTLELEAPGGSVIIRGQAIDFERG